MALKVAELVATLGIDAKSMDRDMERSVAKATADLGRVVKEADRVGRDAGTQMSAGLEVGLSDLGGIGEQRLRSSDLEATARRVGDDAGAGLKTGFDAGAVGVGSGIDADLRARLGDLEGLGNEAGEGIGGGILDGMPDLSGGLEGLISDALGSLPVAAAGPAVAAGTAIGALTVQGFGEAISNLDLAGQLRAELGASDGEAAQLGRLTGELWRNNFAGSMEEAADSVAIVERNLEGVGSLSQAELQKVNQAALTTSQVFEQDLGMAVNAVSQMIRTDLVDDAEEGFDLITRGLQGPANKADDLLETFNEYSTQFRKLGLEGPEALGLIQQAVEAGARDADIAADALGEFTKKAVDGSEPVSAAFETLGLDVKAVSDAIAAGGGEASAALDVTLDRLRAIEDPTLRAQTATALFGTQAEDLGDALFAMDLSTAAAEIGDFAGAAAQAQEDVAGLASGLEVFRRELSSGFTRGAEAAFAVFGESELEDGGMSSGQKFAQAFGRGIEFGIGNLFGGGDGIRQVLGRWSEEGGVTDSMTSDLREVSDALEGGTVGLDIFGASAFNASGDTAILSEEVTKLEDTVKPLGSMLELGALRADTFRQALSNRPSTGLLDTALDTWDAFNKVRDSIGDLSPTQDISDIANGLISPAEDAKGVLEDLLAAAGPLQERIASVLEFQGADKAVAKADSIRNSLTRIFTEAGLGTEQITELLDAMGLAEGDIDMAIKLSGAAEAMAQIQILQGMVGELLSPVGQYGELSAYIALKIQEGDFTAARDLMVAFQEDITDGSLDNPILLAVNADPTMADTTVSGWKSAVAGMPPVDMQVGAATGGALGAVLGLRNTVANLPPVDIKFRAALEGGAVGAAIGLNLPKFHDGGVVPGPIGAEVPIMALGGEVVTPLSDVGGMAMPPVYMPESTMRAAEQAGGGGATASELRELGAQVAANSAEVRTLARQVAMKGDTNNFYGANAAEVTAEQASRKRARAWSAGL